MDAPLSAEPPAHEQTGCKAIVIRVALFFSPIVLLLGILLIPAIIGGLREARLSATVQNCRSIASAMHDYAKDHDGHYPDGRSSTEAFQKLLDGRYLSDISIFYLQCHGKTKPTPEQKSLKPENVCWDITSGVNLTSPDGLPVVFQTGLQVDYEPGSSAVLSKLSPVYSAPERTWTELCEGERKPYDFAAGAAVTYKNMDTYYVETQSSTNGGLSIPRFVREDYHPDGKAYRQLTPDGILP